MPIVCGVKFRGAGKIYFFSPGDYPELQEDDAVVVETSRGCELGHVLQAPHDVADNEVVGELKAIVRQATTLDLLDAQRHSRMEQEATERCEKEVQHANLPMRIIGAEYNFDGTRLTFFFTSEKRVDFRDLVRELARTFKTRIELRQIGVRDQAKIIGGVGKCGRELCCATWLSSFAPVSIRMAKQQDLPLSPMEISGVCGRLLCCLRYENDQYQAVKKLFPRVGKTVDTPLGPAKVLRVSAIREKALLLLEDGSTIELDEEQLAGRAPIESPEDPQAARGNEIDRSLAALRQRAATRSQTAEDSDDEEDANGDDAPQQRCPPRRPSSPEPRRSAEPAPPSAPAQQEDQQPAAEDAASTSRKRSRSGRRRRRGGRRGPGASGDEGNSQNEGGAEAKRNKPDAKRPKTRP
jgi:cell fate regulator YaaT (PSP1 superfamily)